MKRLNKIAVSLVVVLGVVAAGATVHAQQAQMGSGMGSGMGQVMGAGTMGNHANVQQLMTTEERTAMMEKMKQAKTPEERQTLAQANHAEMEKRAKEKGIELPSMKHDHQMGIPGMGMPGMGMPGQPG